MKTDFPYYQLLLIALLFFSLHLYGQSTGHVKFHLYPTNAVIKINDQLYEYQSLPEKSIALPAGEYHMEIWAPQYAIHTDTIAIKTAEVTSYNKTLNQLSVKYATFVEDQKYYRSQKFIRAGEKVLLLGAVAASGLLTYTAGRKEVKDLRDKTQRAVDVFQTTSDPVTRFNARLDYEECNGVYEDKKKSYNTKVIVGSIVFAGISAYTGYYFLHINKKREKLQKPIYEKEENPLLGVQLDMIPAEWGSTSSPGLRFVVQF